MSVEVVVAGCEDRCLGTDGYHAKCVGREDPVPSSSRATRLSSLMGAFIGGSQQTARTVCVFPSSLL